jgi:hypothetical protein
MVDDPIAGILGSDTANATNASDDPITGILGTDTAQGTTTVNPEQASRRAMNPTLRAIDATGRGIANAVPFMSDIAAAGDTAVSYLPQSIRQYIPGVPTNDQSSETWSQRYSENLARQRSINATDETDLPVESYGGQFAGALALPVGGVNKIANFASRYVPLAAARSLASGAVGAGYGALYGAGSGTDLADRAQRAETGALYGGIGGAIVPAATGLIGSVVSPFVNKVSPAVSKIGNALQRDVASGAAMAPEDIAAAQASGQPLAVADIGGEATRALARSAANLSPEARAALSNTVNDRFAQQGPRFSSFLKGMFGTDLNNATALTDLAEKSKATVGPLYKQAYAEGENGVWNDTLANLVQAPDMRGAIADAAKKGANTQVLQKIASGASPAEPPPIIRNPFVSDAEGNLSLKVGENGQPMTPNLQFWDQVKRALQDKIDSARASRNMEDARDFGQLKSALVNQLDAAVPTYADARMGAFQKFGAENALEAGQNFVGMTKSLDIDQMKASLAKMSPEQKSFFAQGMASQIAQKAENSSERRNIIGLFDSPATREKMQAGLGMNNANQIEAFLRREAIMDRLRTSLGNSTTARQLAELGMAGAPGIFGMIRHAAANPTAGAIAGATTSYYNNGLDPVAMAKGAMTGALGGLLVKHVEGLHQASAQRIGELLASTNPEDVRRAIQAVSRQPKLLHGFRRIDHALTYTVPERMEDNSAEPAPAYAHASGGRVSRATGGRAAMDHEAAATRLVNLVDRVRKNQATHTKPLLKLPDETIARALSAANQAIAS